MFLPIETKYTTSHPHRCTSVHTRWYTRTKLQNTWIRVMAHGRPAEKQVTQATQLNQKHICFITDQVQLSFHDAFKKTIVTDLRHF